MTNSAIYESFTLPSKGKIYDEEINPHVTLRSMTTLEEMQRLSPTDMPYKVMSEIIETCLKEPLPIHVCDLAIGDYQFLLHKLRIVTYGPQYKMTVKCSECGATTETIADLESLEVSEWTPEIEKDKIIHLPKTNHYVELRF